MIEIKFSTYSDMIEIEDILFSAKCVPRYISNNRYYKTYNEREILGYMGTTNYLIVQINDHATEYIITHNGYGDSVNFVYPIDKIAIRNELLTPSYKGRSIRKI